MWGPIVTWDNFTPYGIHIYVYIYIYIYHGIYNDVAYDHTWGLRIEWESHGIYIYI